jgi:mannose-6-phosphate isomerase-like protein (cupin superfamily)
MIIRDLRKTKKFISGDGALLKELFNPLKDDLELRYSLAHAVVKPGRRTHSHKLKTSEVYYILRGRGVMHVGEEAEPVRAGQAIYVPPNSIQFIENRGRCDLVFLCLVDPAWQPENEEILA